METTMPKKILCAVDGSDHSATAVRQAAELAKAMGAELTLIAVNLALGGPRGPLAYSWDDAEADVVAAKAQAAAKAAGFVDAKSVIAKGRDPAGSIVHYAYENGFDHIVTGTGEKHGLSKLVLGSVSADVAAKAHCPVTIAR
jgi:nucleotide-binding universal stress UspA family protein